MKRSRFRGGSGLLLRGAAAFLVAACAPVAMAAPLHFNGTLTFQVGSVGPIEIAGSGEVGVTGLPANPRVAIPAAAFAGQVVMPITDPNVFPIAAIVADGSNQAGTLERGSPGEPIGGSMPLAGVAKVCLYATCDASPITNLSIPLSVVGRHATAYATGPVNLTVIGAPWTTGEITNTSPGGAQAGSDHIALNVITPIFISSNLGTYPQIPAHARLTLVAGADCDNGLDDDGDLLVDYPADDGCYSRDDLSEGLGSVESCRNGVDDDGDGFTDFGPESDPGCSALRDSSERSTILPCDNDLDDDHDGLKDNLDPGCTSPTDFDEADLGDGVCNDGQDQDFDGLADFPLDPGCASIDDSDERGDLACDDVLDADGDGRAAYPADPGCVGPSDADERQFTLVCDDGLDNDGDGAVDFPADGDCGQWLGSNEGGVLSACANGIDDDEDGVVDMADTGCGSASDDLEEIVVDGSVALDATNTLPDESARAMTSTGAEVREGGLVGHRLWVTNGWLGVTGGSIGGDLRVRSSGSMSGGSVGGTLRLYGSVAFFQVSGGTIGGIEAADESRLRIRVTDTGGRALGPVAESAGTLAVTLLDGTPWSVPFLREPTARIELAPEPDSVLGALAAVAGLAALARRRVLA